MAGEKRIFFWRISRMLFKRCYKITIIGKSGQLTDFRYIFSLAEECLCPGNTEQKQIIINRCAGLFLESVAQIIFTVRKDSGKRVKGNRFRKMCFHIVCDALYGWCVCTDHPGGRLAE